VSDDTATDDTATVSQSGPDTGAKPDGESAPDAATATGDKGDSPDTPLGDSGKAALDKERESRREAERNVARLRDRVSELEDAGKSDLDRATSQLKRATDDLAKASARVSELEGEISRRDLEALKRQVAEEHDLPASVAKRLQGTDLRELRSDAKLLRDELNSGTPVGSLGIGRGGTATGSRRGSDMNQLIREAAGRG
jgi:hypothetical protein